MLPDPDVAYRAMETKDSRFDGQFITAVRTTGIYCRPGCPARTPKRQNVTFYPTSAAAQAAGFRACKRCLPDATPGSPEWNLRADTVGAAMRLIGDGVVDREGVPGLAQRLGYTTRHLGRLLVDELGASPLALARARRAHSARMLLTSTTVPMSDIAFAAGFNSVRQFNDTVREVFDTDPSALRSAGSPAQGPPGTIALRLPVRAPFAATDLLAFLAARAVIGVDQVEGRSYTRSLRLPTGVGVVRLDFPDDDSALTGDAAGRASVAATLTLTHLADLAPAVARCRRLLDADADPVGIDAVLAADPALSELVNERPGLRLPGAVDGFEILVRAVLGQQVSVQRARGSAAALTELCGERLTHPVGDVTTLFPSPAAVADLTTADIPGPRRRAQTIIDAARDIRDGSLVIDPGRRAAELTADLVARHGIGQWTADYVAMRVLGDPDRLLTGDLVVRQGAAALGLPSDPKELDARSMKWRPFRSYAGLHLWRVASRPAAAT